MGKLIVGQVISSTFPFSDLSSQKRRPALVVATVDFGDVILCQITSKTYSSSNPIKLSVSDFNDGGLPIDSFIRYDKLFTADEEIVEQVYGEISQRKLGEVLDAIRALFTI
jgi:mRNA interferase MazF